MKMIIVTLCFAMLVVLTFNSSAIADVWWEDGKTHIIDEPNSISGNLWLDRLINNIPGTHVDLIDGGMVQNDLLAYNNSSFTQIGGTVGRQVAARDTSTVLISGGSIGSNLFAGDYGIVTMTGGVVGGQLSAYQYSTVSISGGLVQGWLEAQANGILSISGGEIEQGIRVYQEGVMIVSGGTFGQYFRVRRDGSLYISGENFIVTDLDANTSNLIDGDKLSDFGTFHYYSDWGRYEGTISGTLDDGSELNVNFEIMNTGSYAGVGDIFIGNPPIDPYPRCINPPTFDANDDCVVNLIDLVMFINEWMDCGWENPADCLIQ